MRQHPRSLWVRATMALVGLSFAGIGVAHAETVALDYATLTVIESTAPLGLALTYLSGGNGLIGANGSWPTMADTPANRAIAASSYDHTWLQYNPAILWTAPSALSKVFAIPGIDHGPLPGEALEFIIAGSNDLSTWTDGTITAIYRDGFDTAGTALGMSDDYTSLWSFSSSYTYFRAIAGDHVVGFSSPGEGEIDGLAAVVPESSSLLLFGLGVLATGRRMMRRRKD